MCSDTPSRHLPLLPILITVANFIVLLATSAALVACGGGCSSCKATPAPESLALAQPQSVSANSETNTAPLPTRQEAARFLTQATFGPTPSEVQHVMAIGIPAWIDEQIELPQNALSHAAAWDLLNKEISRAFPGQHASSGEVVSSFMRQAISSDDQLRQRVAFALSEIFVVSIKDSCGDGYYARGVAGYLDMLGRHAFGSFRDLLESVALNPVMGCYLSHIKNRGEDLKTGRVPDENFSREIMQLFSIGLYELNKDGTLRFDAFGQPIETYGSSDIAGLAKVFTGWSWWCPSNPTPSCFDSDPFAPDQFVTNMRPYGQFHSTSEKRFLKTVIPSSVFSTPASDLKTALDALSTHPNVGPFLCRQLIQRLVTSNPTPAYVKRVASAFDRSGGSLKEAVRAILLDPEARDMSALNSAQFGKVREPILRFTALARAIGVSSDTGMFLVTSTEDPGYSLGQSPMGAPSVFNFFRPGYVQPGSRMAAAALVTPELQIATETSAAGYVNFLSSFMWAGLGSSGYARNGPRLDIQVDANINPQHPLLLLTESPGELIEELNQRLMYGAMPDDLASIITKAVQSIDFRYSSPPTSDQISLTRHRRLWTALLLTAASPEFQVQK